MKSFKVLAALICAVLLLSVSAFASGKGESDSAGKEKVIWAAYGYLDEGRRIELKPILRQNIRSMKSNT